MITFSSKYESALILALKAHKGQFRKGTNIPYIVHPIHVSHILSRHGFSEDIIVAGLLHDIIEDCDVDLEFIKNNFGITIANIVDVLTEQKKNKLGTISWEKRKTQALTRLSSSNAAASAVKAADILHNSSTILEEFKTYGDAIWKRFRRGPQKIIENYKVNLSVLKGKLKNHSMLIELESVINEIESLIS